MFKRLARFRHFEPRRSAPRWLQAVHSNDNLPGCRRPTGVRRSRPPTLACHWSRVDGSRLECRWEVECFDEPRRASSVWTGTRSDERRT
jgi:hypothetical protein